MLTHCVEVVVASPYESVRVGLRKFSLLVFDVVCIGVGQRKERENVTKGGWVGMFKHVLCLS